MRVAAAAYEICNDEHPRGIGENGAMEEFPLNVILSRGPEDVKDYRTEDVLKMTCSLRWYYNSSPQISEKIKH